jgi:hypothetical protein
MPILVLVDEQPDSPLDLFATIHQTTTYGKRTTQVCIAYRPTFGDSLGPHARFRGDMAGLVVDFPSSAPLAPVGLDVAASMLVDVMKHPEQFLLRQANQVPSTHRRAYLAVGLEPAAVERLDANPPQADMMLLLPELPDAYGIYLKMLMDAAENLAWQHLHEALGTALRVEDAPSTSIFISYRKGHEEMAERVAMFLGRAGFVPWFDAWDILAGDSLAGRINEGLEGCGGFVCLLSAEYDAGRWATAELEAALQRRVEDGIPVIPVLLDRNARKPPLLRSLVHVDLSDGKSERFHSRAQLIVDGLKGRKRNPFRTMLRRAVQSTIARFSADRTAAPGLEGQVHPREMVVEGKREKRLVFESLLATDWVNVRVDARKGGVLLPDRLMAESDVSLEYGRDMPRPIPDLLLTTEGIRATLSFDSRPFLSFIPWTAVFYLGRRGGGGYWYRDAAPAEYLPSMNAGTWRG